MKETKLDTGEALNEERSYILKQEVLLEQIFSSFRAKFPPVHSVSEASLKLSTTEIDEMITDFWPDMELSSGDLIEFLIKRGYSYEAIEVNGRVRYFWLIGQE